MTAVFSEVLKMSLSAAFLVAIVIGVRWCFRKGPKWVHCILWALVAVRLICPSLPQSQLSMVPEPVSDGQVIVRVVEEMPRLVPSPAATVPKLPETPVPISESHEAESPASVETTEVKAPIPWMTILCGVWLAGVAAMGVYALISYLQILKKVGPCVEVGNGIYLCDYIDTPFLLGFRRPRIYLPSYLNTDTAAYVLAHERSHIRRRDHWWKPMGFVLLSIHWFNPMIWLGYILLCRDIEMACDEAVVKTMGSEDKKGYSHALLTCSIPRSTISICPLAFGEVSVKERIRSVLSYKKPTLWLTLVGVVAVVLGAVFFLTDPQKKIPPEDVEYLETAVYVADKDALTVKEYDDEYRITREVYYEEGTELFRQEYSYKRLGSHLTKTIVCTHPQHPDKTSRSFSVDGVVVFAGKTVTLVYEEKLNENGDPLESVLTADGVWECTRTYTYDEAGNLVAQTKDAQPSGSRIGEHYIQNETFTYDTLGNLLSKQSQSERLGRTSSHEMKWQRDEDGNILRFQYYSDDHLVVDEHYTLDELGRVTSRTDLSSDGSSTTYSIDRNEELMREIITQTGAAGDSIGMNFYDERDNLLSDYYQDADGNYSLRTARNYIGNDGFKSTGIPEEIYTEEKNVHANPEPYVLEEDVPYYPTAKYEQDSDTLTVYDYDEDFHLKQKTTYVDGYETGKHSYQFVTVEDDSRDITTLTPSYSAQDYVVYHQVNSKGQITQSIRYARGGIWESTHRYSYDAFGKLEMVEGASPERVWKIFYTPEKTGMECCHLWMQDADVEGPVIPETDFALNERIDRMFLPDILEETRLYSHETDEMILTQEPIQYDGYSFDHSYGKRNIHATLRGKMVFGQSNTLDSKGNVLNSNLGDDTGNHMTYFNYISRDGHESRGIPEKIYPANFQAKEKASYPSAKYDSETGQLTKYEYDRNYQLTGTSVWRDGEKIAESVYRYKTKGDTLTITEKKREGGKKTELVYTKDLDENGNVVKSTLHRDGAWNSTYLFQYFPGGGIKIVVGYNSEIGFRLLNDQFGQKIRYRTGAFTEADVPENAVWLETPEMQAGISEKWHLPGMIDDKLYFHELDEHLLSLGERHDDEYSWNGGGSGSADGSGRKVANVQIRRWEDSSLAEGQTLYMTADDHPLWKEIYDNEWCAFNNNIYTYYNYINTDGTKIAGIPEDLYFDTAGEWLTSYSYTPTSIDFDGSSRTMDYVELNTSKFWFDPSIPEDARQDCISATNRIYNALWADYEPQICVLADGALDRPYVEGSTLYTTARDFRSREYAADVIIAANGEYTLYGLAYGYANFLCDKLGWQVAENTEFVMPQNVEAADLNVLCFDERYRSKEDITAAKQLACWFTNTFLLREDKNNYHIRLWMSNDPDDMNEYVCKELAEYYAASGLDYRPTQVMYARSGNGLVYTANVGGEIIPVSQSQAEDYAGVRAFFEEKLPWKMSSLKEMPELNGPLSDKGEITEQIKEYKRGNCQNNQ